MGGRRFLAVLVCGPLLLAPAACGGDDDDADAGPGATTDLPDDVEQALDQFVPEDCQFLLSGAFLNPAAAFVPGADVDFGESADRFDELADAAPSELEDDLDVIANRFERMGEVVKDLDMSDPMTYQSEKGKAALAQLDSIFDDEYEAATAALSTYVDENCSSEG